MGKEGCTSKDNSQVISPMHIVFIPLFLYHGSLLASQETFLVDIEFYVFYFIHVFTCISTTCRHNNHAIFLASHGDSYSILSRALTLSSALGIIKMHLNYLHMGHLTHPTYLDSHHINHII